MCLFLTTLQLFFEKKKFMHFFKGPTPKAIVSKILTVLHHMIYIIPALLTSFPPASLFFKTQQFFFIYTSPFCLYSLSYKVNFIKSLHRYFKNLHFAPLALDLNLLISQIQLEVLWLKKETLFLFPHIL